MSKASYDDVGISRQLVLGSCNLDRKGVGPGWQVTDV